MGKRINRTIKNWRWWVILPLVPIAMAIVALGWIFRLPVMALAETGRGISLALRWASRGNDMRANRIHPALRKRIDAATKESAHED